MIFLEDFTEEKRNELCDIFAERYKNKMVNSDCPQNQLIKRYEDKETGYNIFINNKTQSMYFSAMSNVFGFTNILTKESGLALIDEIEDLIVTYDENECCNINNIFTLKKTVIVSDLFFSNSKSMQIIQTAFKKALQQMKMYNKRNNERIRIFVNVNKYIFIFCFCYDFEEEEWVVSNISIKSEKSTFYSITTTNAKMENFYRFLSRMLSFTVDPFFKSSYSDKNIFAFDEQLRYFNNLTDFSEVRISNSIKILSTIFTYSWAETLIKTGHFQTLENYVISYPYWEVKKTKSLYDVYKTSNKEIIKVMNQDKFSFIEYRRMVSYIPKNQHSQLKAKNANSYCAIISKLTKDSKNLEEVLKELFNVVTVSEFDKYFDRLYNNQCIDEFDGYLAEYLSAIVKYEEITNTKILCKEVIFSKSLKLDLDRLKRKIKTIKEEKNKKKFDEIFNKRVNCFTYNINDKYLVKLISSPQELIEEGEKMCSCVASYLNRILDNQALIFSIREKESPTIPIVTVQYDIDRKTVVQYKARYNESLEDNLMELLQIWCDKNDIEISEEEEYYD